MHSCCRSILTLLRGFFNLSTSSKKSNQAGSCSSISKNRKHSKVDKLKKPVAKPSETRIMDDTGKKFRMATQKGLSFAEANRKARIVYFIEDDPRLEIRAASNGGFELRRITTNPESNQENHQTMSPEDLKRFSTLLQASVILPMFRPMSTPVSEDEAHFKSPQTTRSVVKYSNGDPKLETVKRDNEVTVQILANDVNEVCEAFITEIEKDNLSGYEEYADTLSKQLLMDFIMSTDAKTRV